MDCRPKRWNSSESVCMPMKWLPQGATNDNRGPWSADREKTDHGSMVHDGRANRNRIIGPRQTGKPETTRRSTMDGTKRQWQSIRTSSNRRRFRIAARRRESSPEARGTQIEPQIQLDPPDGRSGNVFTFHVRRGIPICGPVASLCRRCGRPSSAGSEQTKAFPAVRQAALTVVAAVPESGAGPALPAQRSRVTCRLWLPVPATRCRI